MGTAGARFRQTLQAAKNEQSSLQIVGAINAYCALMAEKNNCKALYLSGAGVASASFGIPDLGMINLTDVAEDARRITAVTDLPLLVDIDTGFGSAFGIARCIQTMISSGVAAVHMEDQIVAKRCGHRPNKSVVSIDEMCDRIKAAVDARSDEQFFIMARTDAFAVEGLEAAQERAVAYVAAGADGVFIEAVQTEEHYRAFRASLDVPILANMTEFGKTELYHRDQLYAWGVDMILYPLGAFRAMNKAAEAVYQSITELGTQVSQVEHMQTREELYEYLDYHAYEQRMDSIIQSHKAND